MAGQGAHRRVTLALTCLGGEHCHHLPALQFAHAAARTRRRAAELVAPSTAAAMARGFDEAALHKLLASLFRTRGRKHWNSARHLLVAQMHERERERERLKSARTLVLALTAAAGAVAVLCMRKA